MSVWVFVIDNLLRVCWFLPSFNLPDQYDSEANIKKYDPVSQLSSMD